MAVANRGEFSQILHHFSQGMRIVDAKTELRIVVLPEDVVKGIPHDPTMCAGAMACRRSFGSNQVLFFKNSIYVQMPDQIERYSGRSFVKFLNQFDNAEGRKALIESGAKHSFVLKPPTPSQTIEAKRKFCRKAATKIRKDPAKYENLLKKQRERYKSRGTTKQKTKIGLPFSSRAMVRNGEGEVQIPQATVMS